MPNARQDAAVYAGLINGQVVFCCHPVVVVGRRGVAASFNGVEDALRFLLARGFGSGSVFRHNGSDWDKVEVDPLAVMEQAAGRKPPERSPPV